jgi:Holin of 3TMs, for gene-transfer release
MPDQSASEQKKEDWMNSKWRPMMGWMYMLVCTMDMIVFPILWSLLQTLTHTQITQWNPLTLQGAGLFHIAMGAVLGIAAFGRTQEKLGGANNGGAQPTGGFTAPSTPSTGFGASTGGFGSTSASTSPSGFGGASATTAPTTGGFGSSSGAGATTSAPAVTSGFGGKAAPAPQVDPVL